MLWESTLSGRAMQKCVFENMRTAKAQISLGIRTIRSGPSLSANRIIEYYKMYQWRARNEQEDVNHIFAHARILFRLMRPKYMDSRGWVQPFFSIVRPRSRMPTLAMDEGK